MLPSCGDKDSNRNTSTVEGCKQRAKCAAGALRKRCERRRRDGKHRVKKKMVLPSAIDANKLFAIK